MTVSLSHLARTARTRWRTMLLLIGGSLTVAGVALPSGTVLVAGTLLLLVAVLSVTEVSDCRAVAQLAAWRWRG